MYDPKDTLTEDGYERYLAHIVNIDDGLSYIKDHVDDLHIGALSKDQDDAFWTLIGAWEDLMEVLKSGDGERDE
jgi:hypothetical protein